MLDQKLNLLARSLERLVDFSYGNNALGNCLNFVRGCLYSVLTGFKPTLDESENVLKIAFIDFRAAKRMQLSFGILSILPIILIILETIFLSKPISILLLLILISAGLICFLTLNFLASVCVSLALRRLSSVCKYLVFLWMKGKSDLSRAICANYLYFISYTLKKPDWCVRTLLLKLCISPPLEHRPQLQPNAPSFLA